MNTMNSPCYPCDKELFPGSQLSPENERESTTFFHAFKIAEPSGIQAVKDTFNRSFKGWNDNVKYMTELATVLNHLGWMQYNQKNTEFSEFYFDAFYKVKDYVEQADEDGNPIGPFTAEEQMFFHDVLD